MTQLNLFCKREEERKWNSLCTCFTAFCQEASRETPFWSFSFPGGYLLFLPLVHEGGSPHHTSPEPEPPCLEASPGTEPPHLRPSLNLASPARYKWREGSPVCIDVHFTRLTCTAGRHVHPKVCSRPRTSSPMTASTLHSHRAALFSALRTGGSCAGGGQEWWFLGRKVFLAACLKLPFPATWGCKAWPQSTWFSSLLCENSG